MRINKKAALELGISTVVVLVIAMVLIAGGVAFIRGFFKLGTSKLGGAFDVADFGVKPTPDDPLVLVDGRSVTLKSGDTAKVRVGFYNKAASDLQVNIVFGDCIPTSTPPPTLQCSNVPVMHSLKQTVKSGSSAGFETFVEATCAHVGSQTSQTAVVNLPPAKYVCSLKAVLVNDLGVPVITTAPPPAETQITIEVTS